MWGKGVAAVSILTQFCKRAQHHSFCCRALWRLFVRTSCKLAISCHCSKCRCCQSIEAAGSGNKILSMPPCLCVVDSREGGTKTCCRVAIACLYAVHSRPAKQACNSTCLLKLCNMAAAGLSFRARICMCIVDWQPTVMAAVVIHACPVYAAHWLDTQIGSFAYYYFEADSLLSITAPEARLQQLRCEMFVCLLCYRAGDAVMGQPRPPSATYSCLTYGHSWLS